MRIGHQCLVMSPYLPPHHCSWIIVMVRGKHREVEVERKKSSYSPFPPLRAYDGTKIPTGLEQLQGHK